MSSQVPLYLILGAIVLALGWIWLRARGRGSAEGERRPVPAPEDVRRQRPPAAARPSKPESVVFIDVETTGLYPNRDRIVSLGAIRADLRSEESLSLELLHLIFNPGMPCHPKATEVHGYTDAFLACQEPLAGRIDAVHDFLQSAAMIVAHNARFDAGFVEAEFQRHGLGRLRPTIHCTMEAHRMSGLGGAASLAAVAGQYGLRRAGKRHGALEDAWLAMMIHFEQIGRPVASTLADLGELGPMNIRPLVASASMAAPLGAQGETGRSFTMPPEATRLNDLVEAVKTAKREERHLDACRLLMAEIERQEEGSRATGLGVAPWYYEQLAIILRKLGMAEHELAVLERYDRQIKAPGVSPAVLKARLEKLRARLGG